MGCHYHVFVGPYLEVHNPIAPTTEKIRSCGNSECRRYGKALDSQSHQFCPTCGSKIRHIDVPTKSRKEFNAYDELNHEERLTELRFEGMPEKYKDYMLFKSNIYGTAGITLYESTEIISMDLESIEKQMDTFGKMFSNEIAKLEQVFGEAAVNIKWGAIAYWY